MTMSDVEHGSGKTCIGSIAVATPPLTVSQEEVGKYLIERYANRLTPRSVTLMRNLFAHPAILKRSFAVEDPEGFINENPDDRIHRFTRWAIELSSQAIGKALDGVGLTPDDVLAVVVNTCTGYICPGISTYLIEKLGFNRHTKVYDLVGSGCGGAIPNLEVAGSLMGHVSDKVVLSVSVEICTATFQMGDDLSLLVSNALFGDGAAAAVLWNRPEGLKMLASSSCYVPEDRDAIRYIHRNGQLYNQLSTRLPLLVKGAVAQVVRDLLEPRALQVGDIKHWALHTGGEKIINTIKNEMGLSEAQLGATRHILAEYGNMSSPTAWFVLNRLLEQGIEKGDLCLMAAFGAGLSAHAYLLQKL